MKMNTSKIMSVFAVLVMISASVACVMACTNDSDAKSEYGDTIEIDVGQKLDDNTKSLRNFVASGKAEYSCDVSTSGCKATLNLLGDWKYIAPGKIFKISGVMDTDELTIIFNGNITLKSVNDIAIYSEKPIVKIKSSEGKKAFVTGIQGTSVTIEEECNIESIGHSLITTSDFPNGISFGIMADQLTIGDKCTVNAIGGDVDKKLNGAISAGLVLLKGSDKVLSVGKNATFNCIGKVASKSYGILNEKESISVHCAHNESEPTNIIACSTDDADGYGISTGGNLTIKYGNACSMWIAGSKYALNITSDSGNEFHNYVGGVNTTFAISLSGGDAVVNKNVNWVEQGTIPTFTMKHSLKKDGTSFEPQNLNDMIKTDCVYGEMSNNLYTVNKQVFDNEGNAYFQPIQQSETEYSVADKPERGDGYVFDKWTVYNIKETPLVETDKKVKLTNESAFYVQISDWKYEIKYLQNPTKGVVLPTDEVTDGTYTIKEMTPEATKKYYPYYVTGWKIDGVGEVLHAGDKIDVHGPVKLVAQWASHVQHTIYYQLDSDSKEPMMTEQTYSDTWVLSEPAVKKAGYKFVGWAVNGDEKNIVKAGATITLTEKTTKLVGVWEKNSSPEPAPEKDEGNGWTTALIVAVIAILVVAGFAAFYYFSKNKKA